MIQNVCFLTVISFSLQLRNFPNIIPWRFFNLRVWMGGGGGGWGKGCTFFTWGKK